MIRYDRFLVAIVIFLAVVGVGGMIVFMSYGFDRHTNGEEVVITTPSETNMNSDEVLVNGWKIFTKELYGGQQYRIGYPPHWAVNGLTRTDAVTMECGMCEDKENINFLQIIHITNVSVSDYIKQLAERKNDYRRISFSGMDAVMSTDGGGTEGLFVSIFFNKNGTSYLIEYRYPDSKFYNTKKLIDLPEPVPDIAKTFEFLN